jgi:hypothetical protein
MIGQITECENCKYKCIRWVKDKKTNPRCSKCKGLVKIIGEER